MLDHRKLPGFFASLRMPGVDIFTSTHRGDVRVTPRQSLRVNHRESCIHRLSAAARFSQPPHGLIPKA